MDLECYSFAAVEGNNTLNIIYTRNGIHEDM